MTARVSQLSSPRVGHGLRSRRSGHRLNALQLLQCLWRVDALLPPFP